MDLQTWVAEVRTDQWKVFIKWLSANDTGATEGHQSGIYIPKSVMASVFPSLDAQTTSNPDSYFKAVVDSDDVPEQTLRAIYYNQKTRNEKRITRWKEGVSYTPFQDPERTGSIAILAFNADTNGDVEFLRAWVCGNLAEENFLEQQMGPIEPQFTYFDLGSTIFDGANPETKRLEQQYPDSWNEKFPKGEEIINYLFEQGFYRKLDVDSRLLKRRLHEFGLFKLVERQHVLPLVKNGFEDVESFISIANSISNRRKSRSGRSLELHLEHIFNEENLVKYGTQCRTEGKKKPDFLFPSCSAYHDLAFPSEKVRSLAVKSTVKDRWRQILNEANRIDISYLFTTQEGVSENQFEEMKSEQVQLVVPAKLHEKYPKKIRSQILSLSQFIEETKTLVN